MKNTLITIIDIDTLGAQERSETRATENPDHRLLKLTLEWEFDPQDPDEDVESQPDRNPRDDQTGAQAETKDRPDKLPSWRNTISLFPDE